MNRVRCFHPGGYPAPNRPGLRLARTESGDMVAIDMAGRAFDVDESTAGAFGVDGVSPFGEESSIILGGFGYEDDWTGDDEALEGETASLLAMGEIMEGDDDFGDDEFGAQKRRHAAKTSSDLYDQAMKHIAAARKTRNAKKRNRHLQAAQTAVKKSKSLAAKAQRKSSARYDRLEDRVREAAGLIARQHGQDKADARLLASREGQGMRYMIEGAPISGQLVPIPFYQAGQTVPGANLALATSFGTVAGTLMQTPSMPFADCRVVGFETYVNDHAKSQGTIVLVQGLKVYGGTDLFLTPGWQNAEDYDVNSQSRKGLRAKPDVDKTNYALVYASALNMTGGAGLLPVLFQCNLIVDVKRDSVIGKGVQGPYNI